MRFPHVGNTLFGRMAYRRLIALLIGLVFFFVYPAPTLVVATTGYLLLGLSMGTIDTVRSLIAGRNPLDDDDDDASDAGLDKTKPDTPGPAHGR